MINILLYSSNPNWTPILHETPIKKHINCKVSFIYVENKLDNMSAITKTQLSSQFPAITGGLRLITNVNPLHHSLLN